ncbi:MAG: carboxypeptidase-like regulatory domain-containing protein [Bryobacterales bacterium]|nr:carboxypeptidase-like regulatory domain-containing protein [Bryobacterales bacterium]
MSGARLPVTFAAFAALLIAQAGFADKSARAPEPYAVIAGTVFQESGFALPRAQVTLQAAAESPPKTKFKKLKSATSSRGEFTFRVPAREAQYTIVVEASGFETQQQTVSVQGEERIDLSIRLTVSGRK